jgi:hypothetical protein
MLSGSACSDPVDHFESPDRKGTEHRRQGRSVVIAGAQHAGSGALRRLDGRKHDTIQRENRQPNGKETEAFGRGDHYAQRLAADIDGDRLEQRRLRDNVLHFKNLLAAVTEDVCLIANL